MIRQLKKKIKGLTQSLEKKAIILCYHRIAESSVDPWGLAVSPVHFNEQLEVLKNNFHVAGIPELLSNFKENANKKTVCISFDDGYIDNYTIARPLLKKYNLPACFFITSSLIGKDQIFWWDEVADIILASPVLPPTIILTISKMVYHFEFDESAILDDEERKKLVKWKYFTAPPSKRCMIFLRLWGLIRPLEVGDQERVMKELKEACVYSNAHNKADMLPMSRKELKEMSNDPLFTIGLHTVNHTALGMHSPEIQEREVLNNRQHLKEITGIESEIISFPYGSYNEDSIRLVKKHALRASFTSEKKLMTLHSDLYRAGRFTVKNWNGISFKKKLEGWFANV